MTMLLCSRAGLMILLVCTLALWVDSVGAGSSFLSPAQKPQGRNDRKPPRVGRRDAPSQLETPLLPEDNNQITVSAPFEVGVSMSKAEFEDYGSVLQKILLDILGDTPPTE